MAQFTIRVELHKASWDDYVQLATELAKKNITDVITAGDGTRYKMPPAEYQCHGELSSEQVHDIVDTCANMTGKAHAILVTQSAGRFWSGLSKV